MNELIFLLMGIMIGLACGLLISLMGFELIHKEEKKTAIKKEVIQTIGSDISLFEYMYEDNKHIPKIN